LSREIRILKIQKFTSEKTDTAGIILKYSTKIGHISDICIHIDLLPALCDVFLAFELLKKSFLFQILSAFLLHSLHRLFIRFDVKRSGETVNCSHLPVIFRKKFFSQTDYSRNIHCTRKNR